MSTWKQEAAGIPPWTGARGCDGYGRPLRVIRADEYVVWTVDDNASLNDVIVSVGWPPGYVVDLEDPDTLAAFDRRLALRLETPEDSVREGVAIYQEEGSWMLVAGGGRNYPSPSDPERWYYCLGPVVTDDPVLARVRAWHSATGNLSTTDGA